MPVPVPPPLRRIPVHSRLFRDLILVILATVSLLVGANWLLIKALKRELAADRIADATQLVRDEVRNLLSPVAQQLRIVRDELMAKALLPKDRESLNARFLPILRHMDQIAGALYATDDGSEYFLLRRDDDHYTVRQREAGTGGAVTWIELQEQGEAGPPRGGTLDYDPRQRLWYQGALGAPKDSVNWTPPYIFHTLQVPGITASLAWRAAGQARVLAFDIMLRRLTESIEGLPLGARGRGFLFSADGGLFVPRDRGAEERLDARDRFFSVQESFGGPLLIDAIAAWRKAGEPQTGLVPFSSEGQAWWGGFHPLIERGRSLWVGVVLPQAQGLGILADRWYILALNAGIILALGIGLAAILVRKYSHQLRDLPRGTIDPQDPEGDLRARIRNGEGTHLEFKSTLRTNLHTGKPGKEIELAWLKAVAAFMNTEGGILLLGVADDGTILGLDADGFENEDRCRLHVKNLINQHLGAEYSRYLHFACYDLEGKRVGVIECERSPEPAFLYQKNRESFFIRSGPSNLELSLSRALRYIRGRF